jgi:single-strand DNA-binding protein
MNKVILMGRLTRDPEVRYSNGADGNQMAIARYTLAVDRRGKTQEGQQNADFIRCVCFGKTGEFTEKYFHQGTKIVVEGRIQTGSYTDKNGNQVYTTEVVVENQEFAESKSSSNANAQAQPQAQNNQSAPQPVGDGFMTIPEGVEDEGLPFNFS